MRTVLQGYVANVLNEREVTITLGSEQGVQAGMKFEIRNQRVISVTDPQTHEPLGALDRVKARVKVAEVHEKFSVARTYETYRASAVWPFGDLSSVLPPVTRVRTLPLKEGQESSGGGDDDSFVKVGDRVIALLEGDES